MLRKGFASLELLVVLILIAVVGFGAYFLGQKSVNLNSPTVPLLTENKDSLISYSNSYFSLQYPSSWEQEEANDQYLVLIKKDSLFDSVRQKKASITLAVSESINFAGCSNPYTEKKEIILDGEKLIFGLIKNELQQVGSVTKEIEQCWFNKNDMVYVINSYSSSKEDISGEVLEILSTFKFK